MRREFYSFYSSSGEFVVYLSFTSRAALKKQKTDFNARARDDEVFDVSLSPISLFLSFENHQSRLRIAGRILRRRRRIREKKGVYSQSCFSFFLTKQRHKKDPKN